MNQRNISNIAVFCGSSLGSSPIYKAEGQRLGKILADQNTTLVYGGASVGMMGIIADSCLENGGKVIGVIPDFMMTKEIAHPELTELIVVNSMHERKLKMSQLAQGFIAFPGGWGTLDELMEIMTWSQLGIHNHPIGILNIDHFFDHLQDQFLTMVKKNFVKKEQLENIIFSKDPTSLIASLKIFK